MSIKPFKRIPLERNAQPFQRDLAGIGVHNK